MSTPTSTTPIAGLVVTQLDVHGDNRGWFKENWTFPRRGLSTQADTFRPVQNNVSFNAKRGATRGMHAEPWDKYVSVANGRVYGAWVDMREGSDTYGEKFGCEIGPDTAVFVPRGVANGFQALEDNTTYIYLVNDRWSPDAQYAFCSYREIDWPLEPTEVSAKDEEHPALADATGDTATVKPKKVLVTGANGQLGRALRAVLPNDSTEFASHADFDITQADAESRNWRDYRAIINCAAYNDVNGAEEDRAACWQVNAAAPRRLAQIAQRFDLTLVHVSTDFVFGQNPPADGAEFTEEDLPTPVNFYGAAKAAGEESARVAPQHYVVRTAWVFGDGKNFVRTMRDLCQKGVQPDVVHDERGRPTYAEDLAKGIKHLLTCGPDKAPYGTYHVTSAGDAVSRDELAMAVFIGAGDDPSNVHPVSGADYAAKAGPQAPRPADSTLSTDKIAATGFTPGNWRAGLALWLALSA